MYDYLLALHVTATALVVGTLFLQSLMVVMALRLRSAQQAEGVRMLQRRVHLFIYYPVLGVALLTGLAMAVAGDVFSNGRWLHWKLVLVVLLIGLGLLIGRQVRVRPFPRGAALAVHILVFVLSLCIIYLAAVQPF